MRAVIYLRISKDDQATGLAVERQREDCLAIIAARGWELVGEPYVDNAVSASKRAVRRPAYDRMVADYAAGKYDALVCYDLDRLTRQPRQLEDWIDAAEERGLVLVTANGEADLATDSGRLFARIKASVARAEIERKGARQKRANIQRVQQGKPAPGRRRYGYEVDGITPRDSEAAVVRAMFAHVADGGSIRSMARKLEADGIDPAPGKSWGSRRVRYILLNPAYGGEVPTASGPVPSDVLTPIVEPAMAAEVRAILADESRQTTPGPTPRYVASGLAYCGADGCERRLYNLAHGYRCQTGATGHVWINRPTLDARVRREVARAVVSAGRDLLTEQRNAAVAPLIDALERNEAAERRTIALDAEGLLSDTASRARLLELKVQRADLEARLAAARVERSASSALVDIAHDLLGAETEWTMSEYSALEADVAERFEAMDIDRQRDTARALLDITVYPGRDNERRVRVWHKVAIHLNPDIVDAEDAGQGISRGPGDPSKRRAPRSARLNDSERS